VIQPACRRKPRFRAQRLAHPAESVCPRGLRLCPTKAQLRNCSYCTNDLTVRVAGRIEGVSPGAITESLVGAGYKSRAGHSKTASKGSPRRLVFIGWTSCFCVPSPTGEQKEGIHPESGHQCRLTFSFSRSLFRPRASEASSLPTVKPRCHRGFCGSSTKNEESGSPARTVLY
jgi:hypothetical protein